MTIPRGISAALLLSLLLLSSGNAYAQAYCALRDPTTSVYKAFPQADNYRSIVKVVNNAARDSIREKLPLDLHFNELGKHTIYVAMQGDRPAGVVHARSEGDRWGLTEVAWALDFDLRIVDFKFQRCRNPARKDLEASRFRARLIGMSYLALSNLLTEDAKSFRTQFPTDDDDTNDLALTVVHSALKTILVTEAVWGNEIRTLRARQIIQQHFDGPVSMQLADAPYSSAALKALADYQLAEELSIERDKLLMYRISDSNGQLLGYLFDSSLRSGSVNTQLYWLLDSEGTVVDVSTSDTSAGPEFRGSLDKLMHFGAVSSAQCSNALELSAFELGLLAKANSDN